MGDLLENCEVVRTKVGMQMTGTEKSVSVSGDSMLFPKAHCFLFVLHFFKLVCARACVHSCSLYVAVREQLEGVGSLFQSSGLASSAFAH